MAFFVFFMSSCLLYKYLSLEEFPSLSGNDASCRADNDQLRLCSVEKITPRHPSMAVCSGNDVSVRTKPLETPPLCNITWFEFMHGLVLLFARNYIPVHCVWADHCAAAWSSTFTRRVHSGSRVCQ